MNELTGRSVPPASVGTDLPHRTAPPVTSMLHGRPTALAPTGAAREPLISHAVPHSRWRTPIRYTRWLKNGGRHDTKLSNLAMSVIGRGRSVSDIVRLSSEADVAALAAGSSTSIKSDNRYTHVLLTGRLVRSTAASVVDIYAGDVVFGPGDDAGVVLALEASELLVFLATA